MTWQEWAIIIGIVGFIILEISIVRFFYQRSIDKLSKKLAGFESRQSQTLKRSRVTVKGMLAEQLYPLLRGCSFLPSDMRFIGNPIDYIVFVGYTDSKDGEGEISEIVFLDVKQNTSRLSPHQKSIKKAVQEKRVRWETIHINDSFEVENEH